MFSGSYVALVTPFKNGEVDVGRLEGLVEYQIESGTHGLVPCGTTGESATMSHEEHDLVVKTVVNKANGRIPVLAGTGSNNTREAILLTKYAQDAGADGALLITPYYNKPTQDGLKRHYEAIAETTTLPIIVYNVPGRTGVNMLPETVIELSKIENIVGVKEASGSIDQSVEILRGAPDFLVLSGDDGLTLPLMVLGAKGVISVAANVVPSLMVDLVDFVSAGDYTAARDLHFRLFPLFDVLFCETSPIPVKAAMEMQGRIGSEIRLPMVDITEGSRRRVQRVLEELDAI